VADTGAGITLVGRASLDIDKVTATAQDIVPGGAPELVVRFHVSVGISDWLAVCRADPAGCTEPIAMADGDWTLKARFEHGMVITEAQAGTPPAEVLVRQPLVFK
jgi:hypothetical protein